MNGQANGDRAEQIQRTMKVIRHEIDKDVDQVKHSVSTFTSWQHYIKKYPLTCAGVATAIGYAIVPRKLEIQSLDLKTLEKLARKNHAVIEEKPNKKTDHGAVRTAMTFLAGLALKAATAQLVHKLASGLEQTGAGPAQSTSDPGGGDAGMTSSVSLGDEN